MGITLSSHLDLERYFVSIFYQLVPPIQDMERMSSWNEFVGCFFMVMQAHNMNLLMYIRIMQLMNL